MKMVIITFFALAFTASAASARKACFESGPDQQRVFEAAACKRTNIAAVNASTNQHVTVYRCTFPKNARGSKWETTCSKTAEGKCFSCAGLD